MKRIYHSYEKWEETKAGMWRKPCGEERKQFIENCSVFMSNTAAFRAAMFRAIQEWPLSCENNLTAKNVNRQAWLGHAACCIAIGCPEEPTRAAWWTLTQRQRELADEAAAEAIAAWEKERKLKARVYWKPDTLQWCVSLPEGGKRLFQRKRHPEALQYALAQVTKLRARVSA